VKAQALDPPNSPRDGTTRLASLDVLRCAAVLLILFRHLYVCRENVNSVVHSVTETIVCGSWIGVDLFLVLSGFLIGGLLFREVQARGTISFKRFFIRRGFKIYPAFWVLTAFGIAVELIHGGKFPLRVSLRWLPSELLFLQNYLMPNYWGYSWSLAVEEHFYIILPILLAIALKRRRSERPFAWLPSFFILVAAGCLLWRIALAISTPFSTGNHYSPTHLRIDSLLFGVVLSFFYHFHREPFEALSRRYHRLFIAGGILLLLPAFIFDLAKTPYIYTVGFTQFYLGSGLLLIGFLGADWKPNAFTRCLAFVGTRSYSIYLWHGPCSWFADKRFDVNADMFNWSAYAINYYFGSIFFGIIMAALIEIPVIKLRDRYFPVQPKSNTPTESFPAGALVAVR
jgi:peptidoglycan/LPS O-acetylase OafA/YrhL